MANKEEIIREIERLMEEYTPDLESDDTQLNCTIRFELRHLRNFALEKKGDGGLDGTK